MTRAYALRKLLEHGSMTLSDLFIVTGWSMEELERLLKDLQASKEVAWQYAEATCGSAIRYCLAKHA